MLGFTMPACFGSERLPTVTRERRTRSSYRAGLSHMALALERGRCGGGDIAGVSVSIQR